MAALEAPAEVVRSSGDVSSAAKASSQVQVVVQSAGEPVQHDLEAYTWLRMVILSDTHNRQKLLGPIPEGDILLHCGDFSMSGKPRSLREFNRWMGQQTHKYRFLVPGNHDLTLDPTYYEPYTTPRGGWFRDWHSQPRFSSWERAAEKLTAIELLSDRGVAVHGMRLYGFPHLPTPHRTTMAFCHKLDKESGLCPSMKYYLDLIPTDTHVLGVHGPAWGRLDQIWHRKRSVGSKDLRNWVDTHQPQLVACGHIHEARGTLVDSATGVTFVNAACLNQSYAPVTAETDSIGFVVDIGVPNTGGEAGAAKGESPFEDVTDPDYVPLLHRPRS